MLWLGVGMQPSERDGESSAGAAMQLLGAPGLFSALCHLVRPGAVPAAPFAGNLPPGFTGDTIFLFITPTRAYSSLVKEITVMYTREMVTALACWEGVLASTCRKLGAPRESLLHAR